MVSVFISFYHRLEPKRRLHYEDMEPRSGVDFGLWTLTLDYLLLRPRDKFLNAGGLATSRKWNGLEAPAFALRLQLFQSLRAPCPQQQLEPFFAKRPGCCRPNARPVIKTHLSFSVNPMADRAKP